MKKLFTFASVILIVRAHHLKSKRKDKRTSFLDSMTSATIISERKIIVRFFEDRLLRTTVSGRRESRERKGLSMFYDAWIVHFFFPGSMILFKSKSQKIKLMHSSASVWASGYHKLQS